MHVTAQPIELSDGNGAFLAAGLFQRGRELRALAKGIGPFARFHLCERGSDLKPLASANRAKASCCAERPRPDFACF